MWSLVVILCEALLISTLHYYPTQAASLSPNPGAIEGSSEQILTDTSKRGIRQVVPTAFKPICKRGERLNIRNECVPSLKLPVYSPKTKRPSTEFVSFTTLPTPSSFGSSTTFHSTAKTTGTTPIDTTTQVPLSTTELLTTIKEPDFSSSASTKSHSSTELVTIVMMQPGLKQFLLPETEKYIGAPSTTPTSTSTVATTSVRVTLPYTQTETTSTSTMMVESIQLPRKHKCYFHTEHSSETIVSSAYEDYDY